MTILHRPTREYVVPVSRNKLSIRFECQADLNKDWTIAYWNRFQESVRFSAPCRFLGGDGIFDSYLCEVETEESTKYLRYYIASGDGEFYCGPDGVSAAQPEPCFEYLCTNECDIFASPEWAKGMIAYQVFPERFENGDAALTPDSAKLWDGKPSRENFMGGDLRGVIRRLDHLASLHVGILYLTPIFKSPSNHKYDTEDYFRVDSAFGTMEDLKELAKQCHMRGMRVLLDGVFNHCGFRFAPFQDVLQKGEDSQYRDWFYLNSYPVQTDPPNYDCVGYYKWMPKMRLKNPEVRRFFLEVGTYWIREADIDGWRLDVADEVDFTFWQEFRRAVQSVKPDALLLGETWKDAGDMLRGDQMDSVMNYLFRSSMVGFFAKSESAKRFDAQIQRLQRIYAQPAQQVLYNLIGSHDTERFLTLCGADERKLMLAAAFQMTYTGMPAIYYGDEIGMTGGNDPDCRKAMDWNHINADLLAFYRRITALRATEPALRLGSFSTVHADEQSYGFLRHFGAETVYAIFNRSNETVRLQIPALESSNAMARPLLGETVISLTPIDDNDRFYRSDRMRYRSSFGVVLPAYGAEILKIKEETV
ncbi:MAG: glycoside hydrolase family 13 protein [Clostridiaceae bacterium]